MRIVVRWLMHNVILLLSEEWVNAQQKVKMMQAAYHIQALCDAELHIFKAVLTDLERMQSEATQAIDRVPTARGLINEMLQERMLHLVRIVQEEAIEKHKAVLKAAR